MPKLGKIVWGGKRKRERWYTTHTHIHTHREKHDKINFTVTVIPVTVRQRVKYEQKSRHRYRVYANSLSGIDERQDVTANIRFPHLSYCRIRTHTHSHTHIHMYICAAFTRCTVCIRTIHFCSFRQRSLQPPFFQYTEYVTLRHRFPSSVLVYYRSSLVFASFPFVHSFSSLWHLLFPPLSVFCAGIQYNQIRFREYICLYLVPTRWQ